MHVPTLLLPLAAAAVSNASPLGKRSYVKGFDVSHYQSSVNFPGAYSNGLRFVYVKATQGTSYIDPKFQTYYANAGSAGFFRGAYHFADGTGDGSQEANYFLAHGGTWTNDGKTLPGMLDLEGACKSVSWIQTFSNTYHSATGVYPILYSSPSWWKSCTSNSAAFVNTNALYMACYDSKPCTPQGNWPSWTIWQYNSKNPNGGDSDYFNGDLSALQAFASGGSSSGGSSSGSGSQNSGSGSQDSGSGSQDSGSGTEPSGMGGSGSGQSGSGTNTGGNSGNSGTGTGGNSGNSGTGGNSGNSGTGGNSGNSGTGGNSGNSGNSGTGGNSGNSGTSGGS